MRIYLLFASLIMLAGCSGLSRTQVRMAENFYTSAEQYGSSYLLLHDLSAKVSYDRSLLYPDTFNCDSIMIRKLVSSYDIYQNKISRTDSSRAGASSLSAYFSQSKKLFSVEKKTYSNEKPYVRAVEDISSYLPLGIGTAVYKILYDVVYYVKRFIGKPFHVRKIKHYILGGENVIAGSVRQVQPGIDSVLIVLNKEQQLLENNYMNYLKGVGDKKSSDYYRSHNPEFLRQYALLSETRILAAHLKSVSPLLISAYDTLRAGSVKRKRVKETPSVIRKFMSEMSGVSGDRGRLKKAGTE